MSSKEVLLIIVLSTSLTPQDWGESVVRGGDTPQPPEGNLGFPSPSCNGNRGFHKGLCPFGRGIGGCSPVKITVMPQTEVNCGICIFVPRGAPIQTRHDKFSQKKPDVRRWQWLDFLKYVYGAYAKTPRSGQCSARPGWQYPTWSIPCSSSLDVENDRRFLQCPESITCQPTRQLKRPKR